MPAGTVASVHLPIQIKQLEANDATFIEISDSSDEESTPKKSTRITYTDSDIQNVEEIKKYIRTYSKSVLELLSDPESEGSSKDETRAGGSPAKQTSTTQRPGWKDQALAKRALEKTLSPCGEHRQLRPEQAEQAGHPSDYQAASNNLSVAITCDRTGILSKDLSDQILAAIQKQVIYEASSPKHDTPGPSFNAQPLFAEGILKLWCGNDHTLTWLKHTVSGLSLPISTSLVVKSQSEIQKRVCCRVVIPDEQGVFVGSTDISRALCYQNPWVDVKRWVLHNADKQTATWFVVVSVPEDQIPILMMAGRRLSIGLGAAYVKFQCLNGRFADVPQGWDPATGTIGNQPNSTSRRTKRVRSRRSSIGVPFVDL